MSGHFSNAEELLSNVNTNTPQFVSLADGNKATVKCMGEVFFPALNVSLTGVLCVPSLENCLLSLSALAREGFSVSFTKEGCAIAKCDKILLRGTLQNNVYVLTNDPQRRNWW